MGLDVFSSGQAAKPPGFQDSSYGSAELNRRSFLKRAITWLSLLLGGIGLAASVTLYPFGVPRKKLRYVPVLPVADAPRKGVRTVLVPLSTGDRKTERRAFIVATEKGLMALSAQCSHLGCLVNWDAGRQEFVCPCHGGRYDMEGRRLAGPPPAPLEILPVQIIDETLFLGVRL